MALDDQASYKLQVQVLPISQMSNTPPSPGTANLFSAELGHAQVDLLGSGITETVGWYPGLTAGTTVSSGVYQDFLFRAPENVIEESSATWHVGVKSLTGGAVGADLWERGSQQDIRLAQGGTTTSTSFVDLEAAVDLSSDTGAGRDTKAVVSGGTSGRISRTLLRMVLTLRDIIPPVRLAFEAYPNPFSPDSEAPRDETHIVATLLESLPWSLTIADPLGVPVRSFSGTGTEVHAVWDGTDTLGVIVPDGAYQATLDVSDPAGNQLLDFLWITVGAGPVIASVSPSGPLEKGTAITITGSGFGSGLGVHGVTVGGRAASVASWSPTEIVAHVPTSTNPGTTDLRVWAADLTGMPLQVDVANYMVPTPASQIELGVIFVKLTEGADPSAVAARQGDPASAISQDVPEAGSSMRIASWYKVAVTAGNEAARILAYASDPEVEFAEAESLAEPGRAPNDDDFDDFQWNLAEQYAHDIGVERAWDFTTGSTSRVIAVLDSGITSHSDLSSNRLAGENYIDGLTGTSDACNSGHGTAVAGIAAADTNNGTGIAGVGWNTRVRAYRVFAQEGTGCTWQSTAGYARIFNDVIQNGDDVINMSIWNGNYSQRVQDAASDAWDQGIVLVGIAGNDGANERQYPGDYNRVITVGSYEASGARSSFSNYGNWVEVFAPGGDVRTLDARYGGSTGYRTFSGTSAAAPHVAGAAALIMARGLSNVDTRSLIVGTVRGSLKKLDLEAAFNQEFPLRWPEAAWVRSDDSSEAGIYFLNSGKKRPVTTQVLASWGVAMSDVIPLPSAVLNDIPDYEFSNGRLNYMGFRPGQLLSLSAGFGLYNPTETYIVTNQNASGAIEQNHWTRGRRVKVHATALACLGYSPLQVQIVSPNDAALTDITTVAGSADGTWTDCERHPNGSILRVESGSNAGMWMVDEGKRRRLQADSIIGSWGAAADSASGPLVENEVNNILPLLQAALGYRPGTLLRVAGPTIRWAVVPGSSDWPRGNKRELRPTTAFFCLPLSQLSGGSSGG